MLFASVQSRNEITQNMSAALVSHEVAYLTTLEQIQQGIGVQDDLLASLHSQYPLNPQSQQSHVVAQDYSPKDVDHPPQ